LTFPPPPTHAEPLNLPQMTLNILLHDRSSKVTSTGGNHMDLIAEANLVWPLKVSWNLFEVMTVVKFKFFFGFWFH
jgi:hypothetical protein